MLLNTCKFIIQLTTKEILLIFKSRHSIDNSIQFSVVTNMLNRVMRTQKNIVYRQN